jgi:tagatose 1,6-diphosphate aldolase
VTAIDHTADLDPGKVRGLQRATSEDGFFLVCALDHLSDFAELLGPDLSQITFSEVVRAKDAIIRAVAPSVSAVLIDPLYALGHLGVSGAVPRDVGLMAPLENEDYAIPEGPRRTRLRDGWSMPQIKAAGVDIAKLLWFFRPDADPATADAQRDLVGDLVRQSAELSIPLVVEPIWYPLPGEDPTSETWRQARVEGIVASAVEADRLGVDMLKVEFPGYVDTEQGVAAARKACAELDASVNVPWAILSAGVGFEDFVTQVQVACEAGASGYLAGRSVWRDAVTTEDPAAREEAVRATRSRIERLNEVTRTYGRPYRPGVDLDEALAQLPEGWFNTWHPVTRAG